MKNLTIYLSTLAVLFCSTFLDAQSFIKNTGDSALSFKDVQLQFEAFKKNNNLNTTKGWKSFKRFEYDMQLHTNSRGEPDGVEEYINAAFERAQMPSSKGTASGVWSPFGTSTVPTNSLGYAPNGIGRINCVAFHPTDTNTYYVGVAQGGLWKTTNGGQSYTPLTDNLPITRISDIAIDPNNPNTLYISVCDFEYIGFGIYTTGRKRHTHFGIGVFKSTDGGTSWAPTGLSFQQTQGDASLIRKIIVNPANSSQILACGVTGIYKSLNAGQNWSKTSDSLFWDMAITPGNPNIVYAASGWVMSSNIGSAGIWKSTDFGQTWSLLNTGIAARNSVQRIRLAIAPTNTNYVYAIACDMQAGLEGIYLSTNAGSSWTALPYSVNLLEYGQGQGSGGQGTYDLALCVSDTNESVFYTGGINLWGSQDAGQTYNPISHWTYGFGLNTIHADIHSIDKQPGTKNYFVCSDGGLHKTRDLVLHDWNGGWPTIWEDMSNGMQITSFYRISSSRNTAGRLAGGAQDNSTFYSTNNNWATIFGGDGMDNYLSNINNQEILGSSQYGNFYYSNDDGQTGTTVGSNPNFESSEWVTPVVGDPSNPNILYIGNENVVKSTDNGQTWTALGSIFSNTLTQSNTEISALTVSPANPNIIYAGRRVRYELNMPGVVISSTNGGISFKNITGNLPDSLYYTGIEGSPINANEVVVCMAGFANGCKVFKSSTGGTNWTNITYNLPNVPVNCIKYVPGSGQLVVATDMGIYYLNKNTTTWVFYNGGLPNVICTDIEFNTPLNKIYVSTFGRGVWESSLSALKALQPNVGIDVVSWQSINIVAYPNPSKGNFTVSGLDNFIGSKLEVMDVLGRIVYTTIVKENKQEFQLRVLSGTYYLRVESEQNIAVQKLQID